MAGDTITAMLAWLGLACAIGGLAWLAMHWPRTAHINADNQRNANEAVKGERVHSTRITERRS
jgi:hypothetical protein